MSRDAPYHLFGFLSMTRELWWCLFAQLFILFVMLGLCFLPLRDARAARRLIAASTAAFFISLGISVVTYLVGLLMAFGAEGPPNVKAALLATAITTMLNDRLLGFVFVVLSGTLLSVQYSRRSALTAKQSNRD
ncbi:MAG TPA: hypothetical protein VNW92_31110 [Polyangiaceae bacterium]|nr:hypothetical protein [Polyangiaceae bacterium]